MCSLSNAIALNKEEVNSRVSMRVEMYKAQKMSDEVERQEFIEKHGENTKECAVCYKVLDLQEFTWHNKAKKELQWSCKSCHAKIGNFNKGLNKFGQRIDKWTGKFATEEAKEEHNKKSLCEKVCRN